MAASAVTTRDEALAELDLLAAVTHALIVEFRTLWCAFGCGLEPEELGAAGAGDGEAASVAASMALTQMFRFRDLNEALVAAGRDAQVGRADAVEGASGPPVPLVPPDAAGLADFPGRESAIARAVDWRVARLTAAVTTAPLAGDASLDGVRAALDGVTPLADDVAGLLGAVGDARPADLVVVSGRAPDGAADERLLRVGDAVYRLVVSALANRFAQTDFFVAGVFGRLAVDAMSSLEDVHRLLAVRGLLPGFTS